MSTGEDLGLTEDGLERLEQAIQRLIDRNKVAGLVTLLWRGPAEEGREAPHPYTRAYGKRDREFGEPMEPATLMRIASLTKPVTAAATLMLVEEGRLDLEEAISHYIPGFADLRVLVDGESEETAPLERPITLHHLLTHTSGLASGLFDGPVESTYRRAGVTRMPKAELIETLQGMPLVAQPGDRFHYSISYDVLGYIIERAAEQPFDSFLRDRIFQPLGMSDTGFVVPEVLVDRLAAIYAAPRGKGELRRINDESDELDQNRPRSGSGGLISTAADYLRFMRLILQGGELDGSRLLQPESAKLMTTNQVSQELLPISMGPDAMQGMGYGYGFGVKVTPSKSPGDSPEGTFWWAGMTGTLAWGDPRHALIGIALAQAMRYWEPAYTFQRLVYRALEA
jgi:CubicO group peptidase (beta-lactamase class C family)